MFLCVFDFCWETFSTYFASPFLLKTNCLFCHFRLFGQISLRVYLNHHVSKNYNQTKKTKIMFFWHFLFTFSLGFWGPPKSRLLYLLCILSEFCLCFSVSRFFKPRLKQKTKMQHQRKIWCKFGKWYGWLLPPLIFHYTATGNVKLVQENVRYAKFQLPESGDICLCKRLGGDRKYAEIYRKSKKAPFHFAKKKCKLLKKIQEFGLCKNMKIMQLAYSPSPAYGPPSLTPGQWSARCRGCPGGGHPRRPGGRVASRSGSEPSSKPPAGWSGACSSAPSLLCAVAGGGGGSPLDSRVGPIPSIPKYSRPNIPI